MDFFSAAFLSLCQIFFPRHLLVEFQSFPEVFTRFVHRPRTCSPVPPTLSPLRLRSALICGYFCWFANVGQFFAQQRSPLKNVEYPLPFSLSLDFIETPPRYVRCFIRLFGLSLSIQKPPASPLLFKTVAPFSSLFPSLFFFLSLSRDRELSLFISLRQPPPPPQLPVVALLLFRFHDVRPSV